MGKISSGNVLDPRRSGPVTVEEFGVIAKKVVDKFAKCARHKWKYGVRISDRKSLGPDVVLTMEADNPGELTARYGDTHVGVVKVSMENGMVSKSEENVATVSEMLQGAATKDSAILAILQQL